MKELIEHKFSSHLEAFYAAMEAGRRCR